MNRRGCLRACGWIMFPCPFGWKIRGNGPEANDFYETRRPVHKRRRFASPHYQWRPASCVSSSYETHWRLCIGMNLKSALLPALSVSRTNWNWMELWGTCLDYLLFWKDPEYLGAFFACIFALLTNVKGRMSIFTALSKCTSSPK